MSATNTNFDLLDEKSAAARLGMSHRTLQAWRVGGGGPIYRKIGHRVFYAATDLAGFVDAAARRHTSEAR